MVRVKFDYNSYFLILEPGCPSVLHLVIWIFYSPWLIGVGQYVFQFWLSGKPTLCELALWGI